MKLSFLLQNEHVPDIDVSGLCLDSRQLKKGDLFFAFPGAVDDGRKYIGDVCKKGAAAVLYEPGDTLPLTPTPCLPVPQLNQRIGDMACRFYQTDNHALHVLGVTGTNGKTSCTQLYAQCLQQLDVACGVVGTNGVGVWPHLEKTRNTTPDVLQLHALCAAWSNQDVAYAALEVSSHGLVQGRLQGLSFDTAIVTHFSQDHLDYHQTMHAYARAKALLLAKQPKVALFNMDEPYPKLLHHVAPKNTKALGYGIENPAADIHTTQVVWGRHHSHAHLETPWGEGELHLPLGGRFYLSNALAVLGALCMAGFSLGAVLSSLQQVQGVVGRYDAIEYPGQPLVIVDYAHTPEALKGVLEELRRQMSGRIICVFGCGGERDSAKRAPMARAARLADEVIVTNDNPREEAPALIVEDILKGFLPEDTVHVIESRAEAIEKAIECAKVTDCVLVAGKGHEDYQQIGKIRYPFSDIACVRGIMEKME